MAIGKAPERAFSLRQQFLAIAGDLSVSGAQILIVSQSGDVHQIVLKPLALIFPSRLMIGTDSSNAVAAIIRSGMSGMASRETSLDIESVDSPHSDNLNKIPEVFALRGL